MPILNYTTGIPVEQTVGEIQGILGRAGAEQVMIAYENRQAIGVAFSIKIQDTWVHFKMPCKWEGVYKVLNKDPKVDRRYQTENHARRVAWRITKDWVEAQLAFIEAGQAELAEVFLPYAVNNSGATVYEEFKGQFLLGTGEEGEIVDG